MSLSVGSSFVGLIHKKETITPGGLDYVVWLLYISLTMKTKKKYIKNECKNILRMILLTKTET